MILNKLAIIFGTSSQIKDFKLSVGPSVLKQLKSANFLSVKILQQLLIFWKLCKLKKLRALPMFTNFYQCLPIFATVYQSFPILSRYFTVFTNVYLCLPMMWQCLPIISKHWLILVKTVKIGKSSVGKASATIGKTWANIWKTLEKHWYRLENKQIFANHEPTYNFSKQLKWQ